MDSWISVGVIEPSKGPWGAPAFIVHVMFTIGVPVDVKRGFKKKSKIKKNCTSVGLCHTGRGYRFYSDACDFEIAAILHKYNL